MANDSTNQIVVLNGTGQPLNFLGTVNGSNQVTFQYTIRTNGDQVGLSNPLPVYSKPAPLTLVPLAVSTVTTGGTAVTALSAGQRTAGGWIQNPIGATQNLGINEIGTASGTTSSGNTTFITPGQTYMLAPSANAVSVISSDSSHAFSGMGWQ